MDLHQGKKLGSYKKRMSKCIIKMIRVQAQAVRQGFRWGVAF